MRNKMKTLAIDDLKPGMLITGLGRTYEVNLNDGGLFSAVVGSRKVQDTSFQFDLYRVLVVDLPYIVVRKEISSLAGVIPKNSLDAWTISVDIRQYSKWAEPSDEYVQALSQIKR